jgi:hypothetical protein
MVGRWFESIPAKNMAWRQPWPNNIFEKLVWQHVGDDKHADSGVMRLLCF